MLIGVGWKLAHPREFGNVFKIGTDQFAIFVLTVVVTLSTDLLIGIGTGIILKIILHVARGAKLKYLFQSMTQTADRTIYVKGAAVFSNFTKTKNKIVAMGLDKHVILNVDDCSFIDHSVMETLHLLEDEFKAQDGMLEVVGLERFVNTGNSKHHLASKKRKNK